ncbi:DNA repair protein RecN [Floridanema aerugineum]|jgi:DNA repair protein RecN (Recombination protein N)|uniref:DNA repair protein RecN n=1 Tax=Floridaenema aerugineum BLCC-F46 TaxID=3153654 RepID=A0ABV4XCY3_9CYAN
MLIGLRIENFALIDRLELAFGAGLNVLTGETGAGKSIILDAIDAALGGKVTSRSIRTGAQRALVEATFRLSSAVAEWLNQEEIDLLDDYSVVCSREMSTSQEGILRSSRSRINGVLVNRQQMEQLRSRLVEITAQGQTVQIGQTAIQREYLDSFGGVDLIEQRQKVNAAFHACSQALSALENRRQSEQMRLQKLDLLEFQLQELSAAKLNDPDELESLEQERSRLSHVVELQKQSYQVYQALYQNDEDAQAAADILGESEATLSLMVVYDSSLQPILDMVSAALAQVAEAARQINNYGEALEADPERLETVEERIRQLKQICRKYGPSLPDAIAYQQGVEAELQELKGGGQSLETLEKIYQEKKGILQECCQILTELRLVAARKLESRLIEQLKPLAMEKVKFQVEITPITPTANGADKITFLFSPNPGEPLHPLTETASGGEMSRFLLAFKTCFSMDSVVTLVFDEIDVGVSGRVAAAIAQKLHQISQYHQVLCVTHQPLVAAMADRHFRVDKQVIDTPDGEKNARASDFRTVVRVSCLDTHSTRSQELAQLAGGDSATEAIAFAESLIAEANLKRKDKGSRYNI